MPVFGQMRPVAHSLSQVSVQVRVSGGLNERLKVQVSDGEGRSGEALTASVLSAAENRPLDQKDVEKAVTALSVRARELGVTLPRPTVTRLSARANRGDPARKNNNQQQTTKTE